MPTENVFHHLRTWYSVAQANDLPHQLRIAMDDNLEAKCMGIKNTRGSINT